MWLTWQGFLPAFGNKVPFHDKVSHFVYGIIISFFSVVTAEFIFINPASLAFILSLIIAIAKEYVDKNHRKTFWDNWDILATIAPSLIYTAYYTIA